MNLTQRKESSGSISFDSNDIMQDQLVEEENFFDMDWEAIEQPLITYSKIIKKETNEITILPNESQSEWASTFENLKMLIVIINDFVLVCVCLRMAWI